MLRGVRGLQCIEVEPRAVQPAGAHRDHRAARIQGARFAQTLGQDEVIQQVGGEAGLDALGGPLEVVEHQADIVDQHVDAARARQRTGGGAGGGDAGQIDLETVDAAGAFALQRLQARAVAPEGNHIGAGCCCAERDRAADAAGRTAHDPALAAKVEVERFKAACAADMAKP